MIDFLNTKPFVGGIRPSIELKTLQIENHEVDIVIIKNSTDTPFFLVKDFRDQGEMVRRYSIYTRIKDTNTPKDSCADINHIEFLWKKRFLLTQSPINRIFNMLKNKNDWKNSEVDYNKTTYYNKYNPEYTVVITNIYDDLRPEFYSMVMINKNQSYLNVKIKYFETTVFECQATYLDETRYLTTTPEWAFIREISIDNDQGAYKYFINGSNRQIMQNFLFNDKDDSAISAKKRFDEVILYFDSDEEKEKFEKFVRDNSKNIKEDIINKIKNLNYIQCKNASETEYMKRHIARGLSLKEKQIEMLNN
ncbi:MAG: hypothetical protein PHE54_01610 [Bacilli bacterium]|nr:hypothetical protein [Bacilli bacterium]